jgi:HAD superfamily hydrolase (TIGR01509 family)
VSVTNGYRNIIFDLGGVILNIDFELTAKAFADLGVKDFSDHFGQFKISPLFLSYEVGNIDDSTFFDAIRKETGLPLTDEQITRAWNALLLDFPQERIDLLLELKQRYNIYLLSNTNALHATQFQEQLKQQTGLYLEDIFHKVYMSHQVHLRKPGKEIYELVLQENNLKPEETLFLDDTHTNFSGSTEAGIAHRLISKENNILTLGL